MSNSKLNKEGVEDLRAVVSGIPKDTQRLQAPHQLGLYSLLKAGAISGLVQKVVSYPLDLLSVRIALGVNTTTLNGGNKNYGGVLDCVKRIKSTEGWSGFYKGFAPTLVTGVPYVMLQMTFFELYKRRLDRFNQPYSTLPPGTKSHWITVLISSSLAGSMAGVTAQSIVFPGDTIRKRMMTNGVDGGKKIYKNSIDCLCKIYKTEGLLAFYSGVLPMSLRAIPSDSRFSWIYIGSKEDAKNINLLKKFNIRYILNTTPALNSGGVANYHERDPFFTYLRVPLQDTEIERLSDCYTAVWNFFEKVIIREDGCLLVHCKKGVSRSVSMVLSFLIKYYKFSFDDAFGLVSASRKTAQPNESFISQLRSLEKDLTETNDYGTIPKLPQSSAKPSETVKKRPRGNSLSCDSSSPTAEGKSPKRRTVIGPQRPPTSSSLLLSSASSASSVAAPS